VGGVARAATRHEGAAGTPPLRVSPRVAYAMRDRVGGSDAMPPGEVGRYAMGSGVRAQENFEKMC